MTRCSLVLISCIISLTVYALTATSVEITTSLPEATDEINVVTAPPVDEVSIDKNGTDHQPSGLLQRLFNLINFENEPILMPIPGNCSFPSDGVLKNIEYQYFCYRIRITGMGRFNSIRRRWSSIKSYTEFKNLLFPLASERSHPFFDCAFDMFFNYMMNRTPFVWLHWAHFDGSRFPFVRWQRLNVTRAGIVPAETVKSGTTAIDTQTIPAESPETWSWDEAGAESSIPTAAASGSMTAGSSDNSTTREEADLSETESSHWDDPGFMGSLKPLMSSARSLYSIYEHWAGFPRLQVTVSLL